ncbi:MULTISPECIES: DeoR/GlpR family DNA-binding transcription regulator [unclassified Arcicella]|uniref:DeoR/GlpR family DNA-binding transcription regulator n=1 Tax=unclassified Arcicella TaxID=2644986 RepID=UPI0028626315|nr:MULTISPECIES: DeoR/GlpR family DNA-binding transcription regulator [unclassified Arcicella]MDR6562838.1 DeoR/GlpR family transcriptional regulator of sugar metabolism [Arcicella sp. BE51]MDR6812821.1 DeoR/GlpR family transcriptional regulator of sugar metabolism [Arcicella sp. BE140]MDR6824133.1 DeoR/GlpR family transcriptional regulator of sugar metabolism [Arcicella sp. BE139]
MLKEERQQIILDKLSTDKKVTLVDLGQILNVSYDSVRRDIIELEDRGLLKKVHGGAIANSYLSIKASKGLGIVNTEFVTIAKKAMKLIENHKIILMDGGTTNFYIAEQLPKNMEITVVTNNPHLATALAEHPKVEIILLGGSFYKRYQITLGSKTVQDLEHIHADIYFMGTNSINPELGLAIRHYEESLLKQKMMSISRKIVTCVIEEKINREENYKVCDFTALDYLITSLSPTDNLLSGFRNKNVEIL